MRMLGRRLQRHQIHHIHYAKLDVREILPQEVNRRERFERGDISCAGHHRVRLRALVIARPVQMPMPTLQCLIAAPCPSTAVQGCLPATITFT